MLTLASYILIIFLASGDVKVVQDLNRDTCHVARDVINAGAGANLPPERRPVVVACINTLDPTGTP